MALDHHLHHHVAARPRSARPRPAQALLDATIACLVEDGYAKTTTTRVAERAGVSRGAHLHHFQTRQALVAAAMEHLAERRGENLLAAAENLPEGRERIVRGPRSCSGRVTPARSTRPRSTSGPMPAPTPTCVSGWSP